MRISILEPHLKLYGGIRRIIELSNRLVNRGHKVTIFHSDGSKCTWMECKAEIKSCNDILSENHDVLIFNDPPDYTAANEAKARLKVYFILGLYDKNLLKGFKPKIYLPWFDRMRFVKKCLKSPYLKLVNATWMYEWLKDNLNIDSQILIGGVNREIFHPVESKKNSNEIKILYSGDPRIYKGTDTILKAIEIVKKEMPLIVLDIYHNKGIPQEKMAEKYCSADIFVDGQLFGGWNNPVAEAMACKVPVVCTDIGAVGDFAFNEKTALIVPPKAPKAMANAILRLIKDKKLRNDLSESAYNHIIKFDWDKSAERLEQILQSELRKNG